MTIYSGWVQGLDWNLEQLQFYNNQSIRIILIPLNIHFTYSKTGKSKALVNFFLRNSAPVTIKFNDQRPHRHFTVTNFRFDRRFSRLDRLFRRTSVGGIRTITRKGNREFSVKSFAALRQSVERVKKRPVIFFLQPKERQSFIKPSIFAGTKSNWKWSEMWVLREILFHRELTLRCLIRPRGGEIKYKTEQILGLTRR